MPRLAVASAVLALVLVTAAAAQAPTIVPEFRVTPAKAGTKAKPRNALVYTKGTLAGEGDYTLRRLEYTIPSTIRIDPTGFKTCSVDFVNDNGGDACPKGSKVGTGAATALLGPQRSRLDFDVDVFAAGPRALTIYLQTSLFTIAIPGTIKGRIVGFDLPERVQQPVPGLYAYVTSVTAALGTAKRRSIARTIGCRRARHAGKVEVFLAPNPEPPPVESVEVSATSRCSAA